MVPFQIIRSQRRTLCIEICKDGRILVRAPLFLSDNMIYLFVEKKEEWILKQLRKIESSPKPDVISPDQLEFLRNQSKSIIPERVRYWSEKTGLICTGVKITAARKRFGSCSAKNSLSFSLFLANFPLELVDYVVVHELCHTKIHNHSADFYRLLQTHLPDWKERESTLRKCSIPLVNTNSN